MRLLTLLLLSISFVSVYSYNYLIISPVYGYSHMKFMGQFADLLADAGHNVTFLQPYVVTHMNDKKVVKNKNVEVIDYHHDEEGKKAVRPSDAFKNMWDSKMMEIAILATHFLPKILYEDFEHMCRRMFQDTDLHDMIRSRNYDVLISESFDYCGLLLGDYLKMKSILPVYSAMRNPATSAAIGEPWSINYIPGKGGVIGSDASVFDRLNDIYYESIGNYAFSKLFDRQHEQVQRLTGGKVRPWREILSSATFFLTNSNPYLSYITPTLSKVVQIGGFTAKPPTKSKLSQEWEEILNKRPSAVLISFGSVIRSADMPQYLKDGINRAMKELSDVTFIWKYEVDDVEFKKSLPENVVLSKWVPQPSLLADDRVKVFVTHGGLGSTMEVAYSGTPAIAVPVFGDQSANALLLARHGGAVSYDKYDLEDWEKLSKTLRTMINDKKYKENAVRLADILNNQPINPKEQILKHAEFAAKFGPVKTMEPHVSELGFFAFYLLDVVLVVLVFVSTVSYINYKIFKFILRRVGSQKVKSH